eukprot:15462179-Alexandrium_andersonii.AAC.3
MRRRCFARRRAARISCATKACRLVAAWRLGSASLAPWRAVRAAAPSHSPPEVQWAALNRPSGWSSARSVDALLTASLRRAADVWNCRLELRAEHEEWVHRLCRFGWATASASVSRLQQPGPSEDFRPLRGAGRAVARSSRSRAELGHQRRAQPAPSWSVVHRQGARALGYSRIPRE